MTVHNPDNAPKREEISETERLVRLLRIRLLDVGDPTSALVRFPELMGKNIFQAESLSRIAEQLYAERENLSPTQVAHTAESFRLGGGLPQTQHSRSLKLLFKWVQSADSLQTKQSR